MNFLRYALLFVGLALLGACDPPTPRKRAETDWQPDAFRFRPREFKPLPPAAQVESEQRTWLASNSNMVGRIYEIRLSDPTRQSSFKVEYRRMSSPLGNPWWTYATYKYTDPTNGSYIVLWRALGRHKPEFLKLDGTPRLHWLAANQNQIEMRDGVPVLEVVGIEGVTKFCAY